MLAVPVLGTYHWCVIAAELSEQRAQILLGRRRHSAIDCSEEAACRDAGGEPVSSSQPAQEGHIRLEQLLRAELHTNLVQCVQRLSKWTREGIGVALRTYGRCAHPKGLPKGRAYPNREESWSAYADS